MNKSDTIAIIRSLLSSTKSIYSVSGLNVDFKKETGIDIPLFGYGNLSDFLQSIPDTVKVSGMYPIQKVHLVENEKSSHIISLVARTKVSDGKNKFNKGHSKKTTLNNRFRNRKIPKLSTCFGSADVDKFRLLEISPRNSESRNCAPTSNCKSHCDPSYTQVSLINYLGADDSIPSVDISSRVSIGEYVEVRPNQIYNPHKFYFHFRKFQKKFADFKDKMQSFYEMYESIPQVTEAVLKPGLICAVFHKISEKPMWFRGEVTRIASESHVYVTFIDFGYKAEVSKKNLKFLHRDFTSLPRQAVLGSLANIRPSKGESKWSSDAVKRFSDLACDRDLIAGVVAVDAEACSVSIALSCTKGSEFHINDTLVKEGYAEFDMDTFSNSIADNLKLAVSEESWKSNTEKEDTVTSKSDCTKENVSKAMSNFSPTTCGTPVFYFSNNPWGNERLQKMFSAAE